MRALSKSGRAKQITPALKHKNSTFWVTLLPIGLARLTHDPQYNRR